MATSALAAPSQPPTPCMDRLDAAHALLGVSPVVTNEGESQVAEDGNGEEAPSDTTTKPSGLVASTAMKSSQESTIDEHWEPPSRSGPDGGLDALAVLASSAATMESSVPETAQNPLGGDSDVMPPPPPRRMRSASNPEGMEKWDSLSRSQQKQNRRHFVLPSSILEEELASANAAAAAKKKADEDVAMSDLSSHGSLPQALPLKKRNKLARAAEQEQVQRESEQLGTSPSSVATPMDICSANPPKLDESPSPSTSSCTPPSNDPPSPQVDEANMDPAELLRRARSRLLEDLSEGSINGEKGVLTLPHSLAKYKEVYNKNGRIGIYTPAERAAIIAKFNGKRSRRVWNKKIRYNCRKNLADRRMRVKGRFVKRSTEAQALAKKHHLPSGLEEASPPPSPPITDEEAGMKPLTSSSTRSSAPPSPPCTPPTGALAPVQENGDDEMPDVNDVEAGFEPTEDQPYRRTRRHTIT